MDRAEERVARDMGRRALEAAARAGAARAAQGQTRIIATVSKVNGDGTLDLDAGDGELSLPMAGIRMTTACSGCKKGDRAVVETVSHSSIVIGILA